MPSRSAQLFGCAAAALTILGAVPARADVSSWLYVGAGPTWFESEADPSRQRFTLDFATGMGTPPAGAVIFGGLVRSQTHFADGTDLSLLLRGATHGFVNGGWGVALDAGGYERFWGETSAGWTGSLVLGAPWGITLDGTAAFGSDDVKTFGATLGLDLARLTVYRRSGSRWWKNTFPAYRPEER